jgi:dTDP-4-dehydrorhamnose reductase
MIIGGSGQLGTELRSAFQGTSVFAPTRAQVDIESADALASSILRFSPTLVINASAYHIVEQCERYPERAFAVNALSVDRAAALSALSGAAFATFSTDYVFDGQSARPYPENAPTGPLNAYGASKLAGEHLTRRHGPRHFIVRTSALYGRSGSSVKGYTFVDRVLRQAVAKEPLRIVDDLIFSPSYAVDVAASFRRLVQAEAFGTYHLTNSGEASWYELAVAAFEEESLSPDVEAIRYSSLPGFLARPAFTALAHDGIKKAGLDEMPHWRDGLRRYLRERRAADSVTEAGKPKA